MRKLLQLIKNKLTVKSYRFKFGSSPTTETCLTFLASYILWETKLPSLLFFLSFKKFTFTFPAKERHLAVELTTTCVTHSISPSSPTPPFSLSPLSEPKARRTRR